MSVGRAIGATLGALAVYCFVGFLAAGAFVSAAYAYADGFPLAHVSSREDLYQLGPAIGTVAYTGLIIGAVTFVGAVAGVSIPRVRAWTWLVPLVGTAAWVVTTIVGATQFQPPPPMLGG